LQSESDGERSRIIGPRTVSKRGGSLQVTIPPAISEYLGINEGDKIVYITDQETGYVIFARADRIEVTVSRLGKPATLGFGVSRRTLRKIVRTRN